MLHHLLDHSAFDEFPSREVGGELPIDPDDFEFFHIQTSRRGATAQRNAEDILIEIGQKIFKHNYMKNIHGLPMLPPNVVSNLYIELQSIIRCYPASPSAVLLNLDSERQKVDTENLFQGEWPKVKSMLDFIATFNPDNPHKKPELKYAPFGSVIVPDKDEDDIYENMFR